MHPKLSPIHLLLLAQTGAICLFILAINIAYIVGAEFGDGCRSEIRLTNLVVLIASAVVSTAVIVALCTLFVKLAPKLAASVI